jgi:8-oxo-dGTP pyrophosphatase MutT (NUDIX family)
MVVIQSAGGIIYYIDPDGIARFLLIKRHAMSGKIERVAPKWKLQKGETSAQAAVREAWEETGIDESSLIVEDKLWFTSLRTSHEYRGGIDKDITYFLMLYTGNPHHVHIQPVEWYLGIYKRATYAEVIGLIYYKNLREMFSHAQAILDSRSA